MTKLIEKLEKEDKKLINRIKRWWFWSTPGMIYNSLCLMFYEIKRYRKMKKMLKELEQNKPYKGKIGDDMIYYRNNKPPLGYKELMKWRVK